MLKVSPSDMYRDNTPEDAEVLTNRRSVHAPDSHLAPDGLAEINLVWFRRDRRTASDGSTDQRTRDRVNTAKYGTDGGASSSAHSGTAGSSVSGLPPAGR